LILSYLAVEETTSELRVAGTQKVTAYSSSVNPITPVVNGSANARRANLFTTNRVQPSNEQNYDRHLPSIRDAAGPVDRQQQSSDDLQSRSRVKTPLTNPSPKNTTRPPSASFSSLFNNISKRSTDNFMSSNGDMDELIKPPSHQSRRPSNDSNRYGIPTNQIPMKTIFVAPKYSGDSGVDSRYSASPPDTNQQVRTLNPSTKFRSNVQTETIPLHETTTKERTQNGKTIT
jgi:hypothetical protein